MKGRSKVISADDLVLHIENPIESVHTHKIIRANKQTQKGCRIQDQCIKLCFYMLVMHNKKVRLRKQSHYNGMKKKKKETLSNKFNQTFKTCTLKTTKHH